MLSLHQHMAEWMFLLCSCLFIPFLITVANTDVSHTHTHTHPPRVSGEDHSLACLHRDREANWNVHCFLTRYCPQISSPSSTGGREIYLTSDVHVGWVLKGLWEDGLVLAMSVCLPMAETKVRLSLAPLYTIFSFPCLSLFLFLPSSLTCFVFLHPSVLSTFSCTRRQEQ